MLDSDKKLTFAIFCSMTQLDGILQTRLGQNREFADQISKNYILLKNTLIWSQNT